jgi:hypothetical protein
VGVQRERELGLLFFIFLINFIFLAHIFKLGYKTNKKISGPGPTLRFRRWLKL